MKSILMTTSAVLLVTGVAAGQARAACPEDIDAFNREYEQTLQNTAAGEALSNSEQAELFGLRTAAEKLHQAGNAEMCAAVIERADLMLESAVAPQVIKPNELVGREVVNAQDENLGEIEDVMIDPVSGRIAYVVIEHGGFLGIGDNLFAVPWGAMQFVPGNEDTVLLDIPEERLENAPRFDRDDESPLERREWVTSVHSYYGVQPYWQDDVGAAAMQYGGGGGDAPTAGGQTGSQSAGETRTIVVPITEPESEDQSGTETPSPQTESQPESGSQSKQPTDTETQSEAAQPAAAANLAAAQPPAGGAGTDADVEALTSRIDQLEQQFQSLSEQVPGEEVTQAISGLEEQMQALSEQVPGPEVTQSISRLEEQVQQLSEEMPGQELEQRVAQLQEQVAALRDAGAQAGGAEQQEPTAIIVAPVQDTQAGQQEPAQEQQPAQQQPAQQQSSQQQPVQQQAEQQQAEQQQAEQQQAEQQQAGQQEAVQQPDQQQPGQGAGATQQEEQPQDQAAALETGRTVVATPLPATEGGAAGGLPCEELLAQMEEDLQRAEELGVAIDEAVSEFREAQAMLNNNSEALCRAAIKRAHEELVAVGFEPTELN